MTDHTDQHQCIIRIFNRYLDGELAVIDAIDAFGKSFSITSGEWQFTLPDLYRFCTETDGSLARLSYLQFRQLLYQQPTNRIIGDKQGQFDMAQDNGHIDRNCYCLKRLVDQH